MSRKVLNLGGALETGVHHRECDDVAFGDPNPQEQEFPEGVHNIIPIHFKQPCPLVIDDSELFEQIACDRETVMTSYFSEKHFPRGGLTRKRRHY